MTLIGNDRQASTFVRRFFACAPRAFRGARGYALEIDMDVSASQFWQYIPRSDLKAGDLFVANYRGTRLLCVLCTIHDNRYPFVLWSDSDDLRSRIPIVDHMSNVGINVHRFTGNSRIELIGRLGDVADPFVPELRSTPQHGDVLLNAPHGIWVCANDDSGSGPSIIAVNISTGDLVSNADFGSMMRGAELSSDWELSGATEQKTGVFCRFKAGRLIAP